TVSPLVKNRGVSSRMIRFLREITLARLEPTFVSEVTALAVARHVVRLSGNDMLRVALPSGPVTASGCQNAVSLKSFLTVGAEYWPSFLKSASSNALRTCARGTGLSPE